MKKKRFLIDVKDILTSDFDTWELWLYTVILPLGFAASAMLGYVIGML